MNLPPSSASFVRRMLPGLLALLAAWPAPAAMLIHVDFSNLESVTFTATRTSAGVTDSTTFNYDGATLLSFFTSPADLGLDLDMGGDLKASGVLDAYNAAYADDLSGSSVDLNLRTFSGLDVQTFSPAAPAFTGTGTLNLSGLVGLLPEPGTGGFIQAGWSESQTPGAIIGEWTVVPEVTPLAQVGVMGLAVLGLVAVRRGWAAHGRS